MDLKDNKCLWLFKVGVSDDGDDDYYQTACNMTIQFEEGGYEDCEYIYCPFCGNEIVGSHKAVNGKRII